MILGSYVISGSSRLSYKRMSTRQGKDMHTPTFGVAAGYVDITPPQRMPLAGYKHRSGPFTAVADLLEANAIILRANGQQVVIVSFDLLYVGHDLRQGLLECLQPELDAASLFLAATHTHYAPATSALLPILGQRDERYVPYVVERVAALIRRLIRGPLASATLSYREGKARHAVNRRKSRWIRSKNGRFYEKTIALQPNFRGPRDETIRLVTALLDDQVPICILWNYACHPVSFPRKSEISADYPGVVRRLLRERLRADVPVVFLQGFAGNVRPQEIAWPQTARDRARWLLRGHQWTRFSLAAWQHWSTALANCVLDTYTSSPRTSPRDATLSLHRHTVPLAAFLTGSAAERDVSFHRLCIGKQLHIMGISAEPMIEYVQHVKKYFPQYLNIPVGYIDEVYGYMPTAKILKEGGYEADGFLRSFSLQGQITGDVEARFAESVQAVARAEV